MFCEYRKHTHTHTHTNYIYFFKMHIYFEMHYIIPKYFYVYAIIGNFIKEENIPNTDQIQE